jgi:hypothetical protein
MAGQQEQAQNRTLIARQHVPPRDQSPAKKKPAHLAVCGLNPIQRELEETGLILLNGNRLVPFIVVISVIDETHNSPN